MALSIPLPVVYAGLAGCLIALIVAAATNGWSLRVFFLLALRLAIGWHFLFEGLHKIHSTYVGPAETNRPFSSEPYFKVAPTDFGALMRKTFDDPGAVIDASLTPTRTIPPDAFAKLSAEEQAAACPPAVAQKIDGIAEAVRAYAKYETEQADKQEAQQLKAATTEDEKRLVKEKADKTRESIQKRLDAFKEPDAVLKTAAKATFARWVYGVDGRDAKVKFMTGEASLSGPERLAHLNWLRDQLSHAESRRSAGLGNGNYEVKRAGELRTDLQSEESDLAKDITTFVNELRQSLNDGKPVNEVPPPVSAGKVNDLRTMWLITAIGAGLLAGLGTRLWCVLGAGFLTLTYLTHPPFPWLPQPPMTEGNPLFVNKNVIEAVALLALATFPTGRWLGLDALLYWAIGWRRPATA